MSTNSDNESKISKDKRALGTFLDTLMGGGSILLGYILFTTFDLFIALFLYTGWGAFIVFAGSLINTHLGRLTGAEIQAIKNSVSEQYNTIVTTLLTKLQENNITIPENITTTLQPS